jgi:hypothetical protein
MQVHFSWQEFQSVVRTMRWDDTSRNITDGELAEIELEIEQIRELLDSYIG